MKMMRDNPSIMASAQKMMEKMSPAELQASSKVYASIDCASGYVHFNYLIFSLRLFACLCS